MSFHKLDCGLIIKLYIDTQREVPFLPSYSIYMITLIFENFYGLMVYFTTFCKIFNILHIVMIGGGGGYVVKTYPSIDPVAAPPPDIINI